MDPNLIYAKTPIGDEAVRQSTRVVQRNLRMVLVQVDGKMTVDELAAKIGNPRLVETALRELENGGFIAPTIEAVSVWEENKRVAIELGQESPVTANSGFSGFEPKISAYPDLEKPQCSESNFSSFGKPILPANTSKGEQGLWPDNSWDEPLETGRYAEEKSVNLSRFVTLGGMTIVVALIATFLLFPYERFKPDFEASAAHLVNAPVIIDEIDISMFPVPHLKLKGIRIGNPVDSTIEEARIAWPFAMLAGKTERISRLDVNGATLSADRLVAMTMLGTGDTGTERVKFGEIRIEHLQVGVGKNLAMRELHGAINFGNDGKFAQARFETADRGLLVDALPGNQEIVLHIKGQAWQPVGVPIAFSALQAQGTLKKSQLDIRDIDTVSLGGVVRGNWHLDWGNDLSMAGDIELRRIDSSKLSAAFAPALKIEGEMSGRARLRSSGTDWNSLWTNAEIALDSEIARGALQGADLGEAVRRGGASEVRAGSTRFDSLQSNVVISPRNIAARGVKLNAGMMTGSGQFLADRNGHVEGSMTMTLQTSVSSLQAPVQIYGTLPDLTAVSRK